MYHGLSHGADQGNRYLLIATGYFTRWPQAFAIPAQEAWTVAEVVVTSFRRFEILRELRSDQWRKLDSRLLQEVLQRLWVSKTRMTPLHGGKLHQIGGGAPTKGRRITPERLGRKIAHLPPGLQSSDPRHYGLDLDWHSVRKRTSTALRPAVWSTPEKGQPTIDHAENLVGRLHDIHNYARQHLKLAVVG
jgi:hypothetical protein